MSAIRKAALLSCALVAITAPGIASAQSADATQSGTTANAAKSPEDNGRVGDITVTARRRKENLQTTPVSATVLSGSDLLDQNVRNFTQLRGVVSNLEVGSLNSGGTAFTIRGVGQTSSQVNADSKAGFYVDEMYVSRLEGNDLYFYDIGNLQVLKGPQGTLFGKNTTAGAVILSTNRPNDKAGGYLQVRGGSYGRIETEGAANLPLTDTLFGRISFRTQNVNGFINHLLDNDTSGNINNKSVRGQLRYEGSRFSADLLGEYNHSATDGGATIPLNCYTTTPDARFSSGYIPNYNALHTVPFCTAYPVLGKPYLVYGGATLSIPTSSVITDKATGGDANSSIKRFVGRGPYNNTDVYTANARLNYKLTDNISLRSISAYRQSNTGFYTPTLDAPNDIYAENDTTLTKQFTQEFTLGGTAINNRLNLLTGVFYFNQATHFLQDTGPDWIDPLGYIYNGGLRYQSYAAFGQASFNITPKLEFTAGIRYTYDKKNASSYVFYAPTSATYAVNGVTLTCGTPYSFTNIFIGGVTHCAGAPFTAKGKNHWSGTDPKFQLSYKWSDTFYTYVTAAHGYNSGGFNQQIGATLPTGGFASTYNPERLWSYEGGFKADLFDRRLQLNASGFYQQYSDIQSTVIVVVNGITTRQFQTAATAHEAGFEAEFVARPVRDLSIRGNASYLTQSYDTIAPGALVGLNTPVSSAPTYQFSVAVNYDFHVGKSGLLTPGADIRGIGKKPACYTNGSATVAQISTCDLPAYALVGVRLDFVPYEGAPWKASFFGTNVLNKVTQLARTGYGGSMGLDRYTPGRPSEFGGELSYKF